MAIKYIFNKKKKFYFFRNYFLSIIILLFLILLIVKNNNDSDFIIIPEFKGNFYNIPKDKGGKKVANTDKKSLNSQIKENFDNNLFNISELKYSIQFFTSVEYSTIYKRLNKLVNNKEFIFIKDDFYILTLSSQLGFEYFLLYKNFKTREKAFDYCSKYLVKLENCLIVDVQKFNN